jgi:hypothetical protein
MDYSTSAEQLRHNSHMTSLVQRAIDEEHHLEDIARDGYAPATLPIVLGGIVLALFVIVGLALGITLAVYYWV